MKIKTLLKIGLPLLAIGSTIAIATPMVVSCSSEQSPSQTQTPNLPDTTKPGEENKPIVPDQPKPEPTPPQTGLNILKSGRINGIETTSVNDFAKATFSVRSESGKSLNAGQSRIKVLYDSGLLKFNNLEHKDKIYFKFMNVEANEADGTLKVYSYAYNENYVDAVCEPKMVILEQPIVLSGFRKEVAPTPDIQKYLSVNSLDGQTEFDVQRFVQESGGKVVIPQNIDKL